MSRLGPSLYCCRPSMSIHFMHPGVVLKQAHQGIHWSVSTTLWTCKLVLPMGITISTIMHPLKSHSNFNTGVSLIGQLSIHLRPGHYLGVSNSSNIGTFYHCSFFQSLLGKQHIIELTKLFFFFFHYYIGLLLKRRSKKSYWTDCFLPSINTMITFQIGYYPFILELPSINQATLCWSVIKLYRALFLE